MVGTKTGFDLLEPVEFNDDLPGLPSNATGVTETIFKG
jgi:hypothetical protein